MKLGSGGSNESHAIILTRYVLIDQHPVLTRNVLNRVTMKTVGERIRQARDAIGISGEALAKKVGYKNQSAIGNLENRAGGTGGNKISAIADALNVSVDWLLNGPDGDNVPFLPPKIPQHESAHRARGSAAAANAVAEPPPRYLPDLPGQHVVSDSDWQLLQDVHDAMAIPSNASAIRKMLADFRGLRDRVLEQARRRIERVQDAGGGHVGGMSAFGELGADAPAKPQDQKKRRRK